LSDELDIIEAGVAVLVDDMVADLFTIEEEDTNPV
jgi:predicted peroxiredoxin